MTINELDSRYTRLQRFIQDEITHTFPGCEARLRAEQAMQDVTLIADTLLSVYEVFGEQPKTSQSNVYGQCSTPDCTRTEYIGGLCATCYGAARRQKRKEAMQASATRKQAEGGAL